MEGRRNFFCSWEWRSRPTVFQIFLIYIKLTTLTTFLSKLVQFICYHSLITNNKAMPKENSEFVTLAILNEMLAAQERAVVFIRWIVDRWIDGSMDCLHFGAGTKQNGLLILWRRRQTENKLKHSRGCWGKNRASLGKEWSPF